MSILLKLKTIATQINGISFRQALIDDATTIEAEANRVALKVDPQHNVDGTHKDITTNSLVSPSMTLGGVQRNTWPASGSATVSLSDVLANGHIGTFPAGVDEVGFNDQSGNTLFRVRRSGEVVAKEFVSSTSVKINYIGVPGGQGFGVGICPAIPAGMSVMSGTTDPASDNYGNYQFSDGSIMCWIPAFYYKYGTGSNGLAVNIVAIRSYADFVDLAHANAEGYALHRAFYDGGAIKTGVFVDKYKCSNNSGTASSIKNGNPLSCAADNNPFSGLTGAPANAYYGAFAAAKTRGAAFFPGSVFIRGALALLTLAHAQASFSTTWCAWYHATNNFPKGCNNNALGDANDAALTFVWTGNATYTTAPKTGSANVLAKTTHNGQNCGVADVNGTSWEFCPGLTSNGANYYLMKTSVTMADVTAGNTLSTDAWGGTGIAAQYDSLGTTYGALWATSANRTTFFGASSQVLDAALSGNAWNATGAGLPLAAGVGGTNLFGNDLLLDYKPDEMCAVLSGGWIDASSSGVWALLLAHYRSYSVYYSGLRAARYL